MTSRASTLKDNSEKNRRKIASKIIKSMPLIALSILLLASSVIISFISISNTIRPVYGARLKDARAVPSNDLSYLNAIYEITFTTNTSGIIKSINFTFPADYYAGKARLIEKVGIGDGSLTNKSDTQLEYTLSHPVNIRANTPHEI